jgi:hypothetical protein
VNVQARRFHQIIDQSAELVELSVDDRIRVLAMRWLLGGANHTKRRQHSGQRLPQLVSDAREGLNGDAAHRLGVPDGGIPWRFWWMKELNQAMDRRKHTSSRRYEWAISLGALTRTGKRKAVLFLKIIGSCFRFVSY